MPIQPSRQLRNVSDDEFAIIDKSVMESAYAVHNKFGRLFDECIYENDLAARLRSEGLDVHTQVPILVTHSGFQKTYRLDLVVNHVIYELKVVASLTHEHEAQALHYAMLNDVRLVKLINFGDKKVHGKLLSNAVLSSDRYQPRLRNSGMLLITSRCERLFARLKEVIHDWGTHLASHLYNEALIYHLGGVTHCLQRLEVQSGTLTLGTHPLQLYDDGYAFVVTTLSRDPSAYYRHLEVLLSHVNLKAIQWINLNHSLIEITTLQRNATQGR